MVVSGYSSMAATPLDDPSRRSSPRASDTRADLDLRSNEAAWRRAWFTRLRVLVVFDEITMPPVMRLLGASPSQAQKAPLL